MTIGDGIGIAALVWGFVQSYAIRQSIKKKHATDLEERVRRLEEILGE